MDNTQFNIIAGDRKLDILDVTNKKFIKTFELGNTREAAIFGADSDEAKQYLIDLVIKDRGMAMSRVTYYDRAGEEQKKLSNATFAIITF